MVPVLRKGFGYFGFGKAGIAADKIQMAVIPMRFAVATFSHIAIGVDDAFFYFTGHDE